LPEPAPASAPPQPWWGSVDQTIDLLGATDAKALCFCDLRSGEPCACVAQVINWCWAPQHMSSPAFDLVVSGQERKQSWVGTFTAGAKGDQKCLASSCSQDEKKNCQDPKTIVTFFGGGKDSHCIFTVRPSGYS
jgi:hypothetical protein